MERRKFLIGMGSAAAGSAAVVGSGAVTSITANRDIDIVSSNDNNALLSLSGVPESTNSQEYLVNDGSSGQLAIDITGNGVNSGAVTFIDDLFRITNETSRTLWIWMLENNGRNSSKRVAFYTGTGSADGNLPDKAISFADFTGNTAETKGDGRQRQPQYDDGYNTRAAVLESGSHVDVGLEVKMPQDATGASIFKDGQLVELNANADVEDVPDFLIGGS